MSTTFDRLEFSEKTLSLPKALQLKQEKSGTTVFWVCLTFECYGDAIVSCMFIFILFLFRNNVRKGYLERATSATVMLIFSKVLFRKLLDHSYVKVYSQQLRGTLTTAFWKTSYGWRFYGHGSRYVVIISSRLY